MGFKSKALCLMGEIQKGVTQLSKQVQDFQTDVNVKLAAFGTALDNIAADEASMAKQISDLSAKGGSGGLDATDVAILASISDKMSAMAARSQALADSIPDAPAAGDGGTASGV